MAATPNRRWMQFSLRTGLLLVTTSCVVLSLWVVPAERQRRAVASIRRLGGNVGYVAPAASEAFPMTILGRWLPPDFFDEVEGVSLEDTQVTHAELVRLQGLTGLQWLSLANTQVTDAGLVYLHGLTDLQGLNLDNTLVTDAGVAKLRQALPSCTITGPTGKVLRHLRDYAP